MALWPDSGMTPERWQQIKALFAAAIDLPADERASFLRENCGNDNELNSEVRKLLFNADHAAGFLDDAAFASQTAASTPVFAPGDLVAQRFKVTRLIGRGGMGEVYEAEDTALGETIALKTIRGETAFDANALARFRREILLARKVTHPNVCRVFDLERHVPDTGPPIAVLTMELLPGETLSRRIRRAGPLPPAEAMVLACQMAEGLQAAHERGIIHRDFKSGNVILETGSTGAPRAVITDFGLARTAAPKAGGSSVTRPSQLMGTPDYMAPEQFEGGEAGFRSDIYSLGVVIFEMITGTLPFREQAPSASALRRFQGPPPTPRSVIPGLNPVWDMVVEHCLQPDSKRRFASASEVAAALKTGGAGLRTFRISRRAAIAGVASLLFVSLFTPIFRYYRRRADIPEGSTVLLIPMDNATGDPQLDGVTELMRSYLSQSPHFNMLDERRIQETLQQMATPEGFRLNSQSAAEVAWRAGSSLTVCGTLSPLGQGFALNLQIEKVVGQPVGPQPNWVHVFPAPDKAKISEAVRAGGEWIRTMVGEAASDGASYRRPPGDTTTSSWEALSLFGQAERLKAQGKTEQAITVLNEAVRSDPHFALAWARLGDLANSIGRDGDGFRYWRRALDEVPARRLTKREELRIRGQYASDAEDHADAEQAFRTYEILYPSDFLPTFYLSGTLAATGRYEEAIQKAREAEHKQPNTYFAPAWLARLHIGMGKPDEAAPYIARLKALRRPDTAALLEGAVAFLKGNY
ncbi:MAG TPA: serine/threonine-protein kinase, partial [Bryobacteraceae bacterium]